MQPRIVDIKFLKRFRQSNVKLPFDTASSSQPLFVRLYSALKNEIPLLLNHLKNSVNQTQLVDTLVRQLKGHCYPASCKLASFSRKAIRVFSDYTKRQPDTAKYCSRILDVLTPLARFADELQKIIHQNFERLNGHSGTPFRLKRKFVDSEGMSAIITIIDCYLSELHKYYNDLNELLHRNADDKALTKVTSSFDQFVFPIANAVKNCVVETKSVLLLFEDLKSSHLKIDRQELFN